MRSLALAFFAALFVAGCSKVPREASFHRKGFGNGGWHHPADLDSVMPRRVQDTIDRAVAVDAALTDPGMSIRPTAEPFGKDWGYDLRSEWRRLTPQQSKRLRDLLLDRKGWQTEAKPCTFSPSVAFRWSDEGDTARAFLCHGCDQMAGREGSIPFGGDLDPSGLSLVELTASIFPEDSLISALVTRKSRELP